MVQIGVTLVKDADERKYLENCIQDVLEELERGDIKYGPHAGPIRAFGALRSELMELQTEIEAENTIPGAIYKEAIQVVAMGLKLIRDVCG